jgi:hypothetical protein
MSTTASRHITTCSALTRAIGKSRTVEEIYSAVLGAGRTIRDVVYATIA